MTREEMIDEAVRTAMGREGVKMLAWYVDYGPTSMWGKPRSIENYPWSMLDIRAEFRSIAYREAAVEWGAPA